MKKALLVTMSLLYITAGINHFWHPGIYISIMPPYIPLHATLVLISGIAEVLLGLLLLHKKSRRLAAAGIIFLLIAVFPANVQMAINYAQSHNAYLWVAIVRLPLQFLLIRWAWHYYKKTTLQQA